MKKRKGMAGIKERNGGMRMKDRWMRMMEWE